MSTTISASPDGGRPTAPFAPHRPKVRVATGCLLVVSTALASLWLLHRSVPSPSDPWLSRVGAVANQFPPGYEVSQTEPTVITQAYLDQLQQPMDGATFIPAECAGQATSGNSLPVGATIEGLRGQFGDRLITVAAMKTPGAQSPPTPLPQCAAVVFVQPGYTHGLLTHVAAPIVPNVSAIQALRMSATVTGADGQSTETVQYAYVASLDDRHVLSVTISGTPLLGGVAPDIDPAPAQRLLIEAANALR